MDLRECYEVIGGDFEGVKKRLPTEKMITKFVLKFLTDGSYANLCAAMETRNAEEAFRAAHTIKGICQNLGFSKLFASSDALSEALRNGWRDDAPELAKQLGVDYEATASAIRAFQQSIGG